MVNISRPLILRGQEELERRTLIIKERLQAWLHDYTLLCDFTLQVNLLQHNLNELQFASGFMDSEGSLAIQLSDNFWEILYPDDSLSQGGASCSSSILPKLLESLSGFVWGQELAISKKFVTDKFSAPRSTIFECQFNDSANLKFQVDNSFFGDFSSPEVDAGVYAEHSDFKHEVANLDVSLGELALDVCSLKSMKKGDVVQLNRALSDEAAIKCLDTCVARGRLGLSGGRLALVVS